MNASPASKGVFSVVQVLTFPLQPRFSPPCMQRCDVPIPSPGHVRVSIFPLVPFLPRYGTDPSRHVLSLVKSSSPPPYSSHPSLLVRVSPIYVL